MGYRRKIYYVVMITVTAACILLGLSRHILHMGSDDRNIFGIRETKEEDEEGLSGSYKEELDKFLSIEMNVSAADIVLEYGEGYSISGSFAHGMKPQYKVSHNRLEISQVDVSSEHILGVRDSDCVLTITLPPGAYLSNLDINLDVGIVTLDELRVGGADIKLGTGNILVSGGVFTRGEISTGTGTVKLSEFSFEELSVISGSGDVSLSSPDDLEQCSMLLMTDVGDVRLRGESQYTRYENQVEGNRSLKIDSDTGNVSVDWAFPDESSAGEREDSSGSPEGEESHDPKDSLMRGTESSFVITDILIGQKNDTDTSILEGLDRSKNLISRYGITQDTED